MKKQMSGGKHGLMSYGDVGAASPWPQARGGLEDWTVPSHCHITQTGDNQQFRHSAVDDGDRHGALMVIGQEAQCACGFPEGGCVEYCEVCPIESRPLHIAFDPPGDPAF